MLSHEHVDIRLDLSPIEPLAANCCFWRWNGLMAERPVAFRHDFEKAAWAACPILRRSTVGGHRRMAPQQRPVVDGGQKCICRRRHRASGNEKHSGQETIAPRL